MAEIPLMDDLWCGSRPITVPDCNIPTDMVVAIFPGATLHLVHDDGVVICARTDDERVYHADRQTIEHAIQRELTQRMQEWP